MTSATTNLDFEEQLDKNPSDWALRLVYSDWLEEHGNLKLAIAQRWMAENKKSPYWYTDETLFEAWILGRAGNSWAQGIAEESLLPIQIFNKLPPSEHPYDELSSDWWCYYKTRQAAELDLAKVVQ